MLNTKNPLPYIKGFFTKEMPFSRLILLLALLVAAGTSAYVYVELNVIKREQKTEREKIEQQRIAAINAAHQKQIEEQRRFSRESHNALREQDKTISKLEKIIEKQGQQLNDAENKIKYSVKSLSEKVLLQGDETPKAFSFYQSQAWQDKTSAIRSEKQKFDVKAPIFDGGAGRDTYKSNSSEKIIIDGAVFRNIEIYDLLNGEENYIFVTLPGLADIESGPLEITGDPKLDKVVMDGCLNWSENKPEGQKKIFLATDSTSETREVIIDKHLDVHIQTKCGPDYEQIHHMATAANMWSNNKTAHKKTEQNYALKKYIPNKENNLAIYSHWIEGFGDLTLRRNLKLLTTIMRETNLPTEFPRNRSNATEKYFIENLYFSPKSSLVSSLDSKISCMNRSSIVHPKASTIITNPLNHTSVQCSHGNQIYSLSDASEKLNDSHGNDIVFPGKGVDYLDLGWGQDIVVLEKGWGEKIIRKTCSRSQMTDVSYHSDILSRAAFTGVGIQFSLKENGLFIRSVLPSSPAEKAGLKKGDVIVQLAGAPVSQLDKNDVVSIMRGNPTESLNIQYEAFPSGEIKKTSLKRGVIDFSDKYRLESKTQKANSNNQVIFDWPYKYSNFLVFGPGINEDDIEEQGPGKLVHKKTGDVVTVPDCFNIFYAGDINFEFNEQKEAEAIPEEKKISPEIKSTEDYKKIPASMLSAFRANKNLDQFVKEQTRSFVNSTGENNTMDEAFIATKKEEIIKNAQKRQITSLLNYDDDLDGVIAKSEIEAIYSQRFKNQKDLERKYKSINASIDRLMKLDTNQDELITRDEMIKLDSQTEERALKRLEQFYKRYFEFDANNDGKIAYAELKQAVEDTFKIVDLDGNETISQAEYDAFRLKLPELRSIRPSAPMNTPTQYPASVRSSIIRMMVRDGTQKESLLFDVYETDKTYGNQKNYVFHPLGGSARYLEPSPSYLAKGQSPKWIFSSGWKIEKIGKDDDSLSSNEIIAFLPHISYEACKKINLQIGIKDTGTDDDSDGIPKGSKNNTLPVSTHGMTGNNSGITKLIDVIGQDAFVRKPFGCFDTSDGNGKAKDGPYVYYHTLIER